MTPRCRLQAATRCSGYISERYSQSDGTYRSNKADEAYPTYLAEICKEGGKGGDLIFPIKKRPKSRGGDWTFEVSCLARPKISGSVWRVGHDAAKPCTNTYEPLYLAICPNETFPSGWDAAQVQKCILYNLKANRERVMAAKEIKKGSSSSASLGVEEEEGEEAEPDPTSSAGAEVEGEDEIINEDINPNDLEKNLGVITAASDDELAAYERKYEPYFLTWKHMGIMSGTPSPFLVYQPVTRDTDTRKDQRSEADERDQADAKDILKKSGGVDLTSGDERARREIFQLATQRSAHEQKSITFEREQAKELIQTLKDLSYSDTSEEMVSAKADLMASMRKRPRSIEDITAELMGSNKGSGSK
jgi:hypothetical protein